MAQPLDSEATDRLLVSTTLPGDTIRHKELIDESILQIQEEVRATRRSQNALLPVYRLPVELLAEAFVWLRDGVGCTAGSWRVKPWIACTHVSQHWRNVALDCPALWSNLDLGSQELTTLMIARSGGTSLNIKLNLVRTWESREINVLREALTSESVVLRLQSIEVTALDPLLGPRVFESWANQGFKAPLLERMNIISRTDYADFGPLSTKDTPVLRHLSLRTQSIDWSGIDVGKNLTCLDLSQAISSPRPSTVFMYSILQQAQNLQELSLHNCLPSRSTSTPPPLSMECLQSLCLQDPEEYNVLDFLKLTHFPAARKISIACQYDDWASPRELNDTGSFLLAALECRPDGSSIPQSFRKPYSIAIHDTVAGLVADFSFHEGTGPHLTLCVSSTLNQLVSSIVTNMDCSETKELSLDFDGGAPVPLESWRVFSRFPNLQSLTLYINDDVELHTLLELLKPNSPSSPDACAFPALSTLSIGYLELYSSDDAEAVIKVLVHIFARGRRPPLKRLTIRDSLGFSKSDEEKLRRELSETEIAWLYNSEEFHQDEN